MIVRRLLTASIALVLAAPGMTGTADASPIGLVSDTTEVMSVVLRFHASLTEADSATVAALLSDDVVILEGGRAESKLEYLSHHFHSDAAYLGAVSRERQDTSVFVSGDAAWVTSISRMRGSFRDREIDSNSAELIVLRKTESGWKIVAVHWSSGRRTN